MKKTVRSPGSATIINAIATESQVALNALMMLEQIRD